MVDLAYLHDPHQVLTWQSKFSCVLRDLPCPLARNVWFRMRAQSQHRLHPRASHECFDR